MELLRLSWMLACCLALALTGSEALLLTDSANNLDFAAQFGVKAANGLHVDLLGRPTVGVLVVVDGEGPLGDEEWTPFLKRLVRVETPSQSWRDILLDQEVNKARSVVGREGFALATSAAEEEDHVEVYWKVNANKVEELVRDPREQSGKHLVVVENNDGRLDAELALLDKLVGDAVNNKNARPALVYATVFGLKTRNCHDRSQSFSRLSNGLEALHRKLVAGTSRPVFTIMFTETKQGPAPLSFNEVQVAESRRLQSTSKTAPFQGSDYVIMFWTIVGFMFLTFFVICCIPWAPALDPALRSTLKQDTKRD